MLEPFDTIFIWIVLAAIGYIVGSAVIIFLWGIVATILQTICYFGVLAAYPFVAAFRLIKNRI